ncbi:hypothetical protein PDR5_54920 [Pseudomonas sp. DR 5-09]|nr:hypothetical protein PDR5_54920 [Pseudomonas sp. DR 5-09]
MLCHGDFPLMGDRLREQARSHRDLRCECDPVWERACSRRGPVSR